MNTIKAIETLTKLIDSQLKISKAVNENMVLIVQNLNKFEERIENLENKLNK